ncbi:Hypothetical predicted protein [Pelobates cultripes]|uniref:Uncharacterized protein n=1 Tax=Pelobates cultripes TaxID=61616 RepID=A0AAD1R328_PELCU|nr:Hypothetical predicted protein [Pelobates cultripes]
MAEAPNSTTRGKQIMQSEAAGPNTKATDKIEELFNKFWAKLSRRAKQTASIQELPTGECRSSKMRRGKPLEGGKVSQANTMSRSYPPGQRAQRALIGKHKLPPRRAATYTQEPKPRACKVQPNRKIKDPRRQQGHYQEVPTPPRPWGRTDTTVTHHHNICHFDIGRERRSACQRGHNRTHPVTTPHGTPTMVHKQRSGISTQSLLHLSATRLPDKKAAGLRWPTCGIG